MRGLIAFATCRARPRITDDDALTAAHLPSGYRLVGVPWDDEETDWEGFESVVLRSTWDYHERREEFEEWLARLERAGVRLWNPLPTVRWNLEKTYLADLARAGVEVVPTRWLGRGEAADLSDILLEEGWERAVVKPTVGASSSGLVVVEREAPERRQDEVVALLERGGVMIQPLLEEVGRAGEWSLVFFGGEPSHAALKRPRPGDVRVQSDFGGSVAAVTPPPEIAAWAARCLAAGVGPTLYARVDFVMTSDGPLLMELELIEPQLFLSTADAAPARFAAALEATVGTDDG